MTTTATTKTTAAKKAEMPAPEKACKKHPAFEADYCPSCGTTTPISERKPATPAKKAATAKVEKTEDVARLSADGKTVLEIGMQVASVKDGFSGEVVGEDKSPRYVRVKGVDGKVKVRAAKTLKVAGRKLAAKKAVAK